MCVVWLAVALVQTPWRGESVKKSVKELEGSSCFCTAGEKWRVDGEVGGGGGGRLSEIKDERSA